MGSSYTIIIRVITEHRRGILLDIGPQRRAWEKRPEGGLEGLFGGKPEAIK